MWNYDILKNAAIGAAIGALASFAIPFMRPTKGAFLGALVLVAIGVYKNLDRKNSDITKDVEYSSGNINRSEEIERFHKLYKDGVISAAEFEEQKGKILRK